MLRLLQSPRALVVVLTGLVLGAASCSGSSPQPALSSGTVPPAATSPSPRQTPTAGHSDANPACSLVDERVLAAADFPLPVARIPAESTANAAAGMSVCTFGDQPDPKLLSLNALSLLQITPQGLKAHRQSAMDAITQERAECVTGTIRQRGPSNGIGSFSFFCIGRPGSVRGGWIQNSDVYLLNLNSLTRADHTPAQRLDRYETVARAIAANV